MRLYVTIKLLKVELFSTRMAQVKLVDAVCQTAVKQHLRNRLLTQDTTERL